jgi:hypothetical protein
MYGRTAISMTIGRAGASGTDVGAGGVITAGGQVAVNTIIGTADASILDEITGAGGPVARSRRTTMATSRRGAGADLYSVPTADGTAGSARRPPRCASCAPESRTKRCDRLPVGPIS